MMLPQPQQIDMESPLANHFQDHYANLTGGKPYALTPRDPQTSAMPQRGSIGRASLSFVATRAPLDSKWDGTHVRSLACPCAHALTYQLSRALLLNCELHLFLSCEALHVCSLHVKTDQAWPTTGVKTASVEANVRQSERLYDQQSGAVETSANATEVSYRLNMG